MNLIEKQAKSHARHLLADALIHEPKITRKFPRVVNQDFGFEE